MRLLILTTVLLASATLHASDAKPLQSADVFDLEFAVDPQISPDGRQIAYLRMSNDIMTDQALTHIWQVSVDGKQHRPLLSGPARFGSPRWSPSGDRLAYIAAAGTRGAELHVRWMDTGQTALLSNLPETPDAISWSPDGEHIAFTMFVAAKPPTLATPPSKPANAKWAAPVTVIESMPYRVDGQGYLATGNTHVFVMPAEGGTPRQLSSGDYDHNGPLSWSPDGTGIVLSANRIDNVNDDPTESELWLIDVATGDMTQLTDRNGPDVAPTFSVDGRSIAYLGYDDELLGYHNMQVYVLDVATGESRSLTGDFDRSVDAVAWDGTSSRLYVQYVDRGKTVIATLTRSGRLSPWLDDAGSAGAGRPYATGSFSVAGNGAIAYTRGNAMRPSDVGTARRNGRASTLTALNEDLFDLRDVATVEAIEWQSAVGDYRVQGWIAKPPGFDANKQYPLILEIHGGPFAAYGPHFSAEVQLYAAAGYVVLYTNPRGSTSYGAEFANEIHHNYPSQDYDDLISGVDAVVAQGYVDEDHLYVTGGSGGGVLTAWIIGKTDRFRAAVVQKPVINWASFVLTSDFSAFFAKYWFGTLPWEDPMAYWKRSPLSLVGNVSTPTMLITGEQDFRTPMPETEQYYQALQLRGVESALVRVPERSHNLVGRPSHMIAKVDNILAWFARYKD
ncbi:MAG: S9 family peptidase [Pseudomonadota bacterium]